MRRDISQLEKHDFLLRHVRILLPGLDVPGSAIGIIKAKPQPLGEGKLAQHLRVLADLP